MIIVLRQASWWTWRRGLKATTLTAQRARVAIRRCTGGLGMVVIGKEGNIAAGLERKVAEIRLPVHTRVDY